MSAWANRAGPMVAAVIAGALTWGAIWASANALLHQTLEGPAKRWWTIFVDPATGTLMLWFAATSAQRLIEGWTISGSARPEPRPYAAFNSHGPTPLRL